MQQSIHPFLKKFQLKHNLRQLLNYGKKNRIHKLG